ncbi:MAG: hypothetical protein HON51_09690 [Gammaproteobacteria bacterium]|nr:hypothetical protein [Gammaproteobacteria bacterium]
MLWMLSIKPVIQTVMNDKNTHNGPFTKGNKAAVGRKAKTPVNAEAKKLLMSNSLPILQKAIDMALIEGDATMVKLLVDKILPTATLIQQELTEKLLLLEEAQNDDTAE